MPHQTLPTGFLGLLKTGGAEMAFHEGVQGFKNFTCETASMPWPDIGTDDCCGSCCCCGNAAVLCCCAKDMVLSALGLSHPEGQPPEAMAAWLPSCTTTAEYQPRSMHTQGACSPSMSTPAAYAHLTRYILERSRTAHTGRMFRQIDRLTSSHC